MIGFRVGARVSLAPTRKPSVEQQGSPGSYQGVRMQGPTEGTKSLESKDKLRSGAPSAPSTGYPVRSRAPGPPDDDVVGGGLDGPGLEGGDRQKRYSQVSDRSRCRFCREKLTRVDYKDVLTLQKLCTSQGRIFSRKRSGNCAHHQRQVKLAIKQARFIGLLNYTV